MLDLMSAQTVARASYARLAEDAFERHTASKQYEKALRAGWFKRLQAVLVGHSRRLLSLADYHGATQVNEQHYAGIRTIPLNQIRGSEGRTLDFDIDFHPIREHTEQRWIGIFAACLRGVRMPPVELIQVGDVYFVRDGHHRVSVARAMRQAEIEAEVTVWE